MSDFRNLLYWQQASAAQQQQWLSRPTVDLSADMSQTVQQILLEVQGQGDSALRQFSQQFDQQRIEQFALSAATIDAAVNRVPSTLKQAMEQARTNIERFHQAQQFAPIDLETQPGVRCQQLSRPIQSVGLYIPGGSAPLFSTVLMLAIPARLAGCQQLVLCSPPPIADEILYAARLCGIDKIYQVGGAQAIAALAFGTESIPKVDKIFGPGNAWVTEAKRQVSQAAAGAAIDMPAGPSEVLVIADDAANPQFIAADLLSQAEHGPDSQVILLTPCQQLAQQVAEEIDQQLLRLPRAEIARAALAASRLIVTQDLHQCLEIANRYGPEHLIVQTRQPRELLDGINSAGSIFLGPWSPESAGDYASGTNHVLPTYGFTSTYSSLGLADFQKRMTVQELSADGLRQLGNTIEILAAAEGLEAHKNAVSLRLQRLKEDLAL